MRCRPGAGRLLTRAPGYRPSYVVKCGSTIASHRGCREQEALLHLQLFLHGFLRETVGAGVACSPVARFGIKRIE